MKNNITAEKANSAVEEKERKQSQFKEIMKTILANPTATLGMIIIVLLILIAIFAPWLAP